MIETAKKISVYIQQLTAANTTCTVTQTTATQLVFNFVVAAAEEEQRCYCYLQSTGFPPYVANSACASL